jgi:hypothetical protein
MNRPIPVAEEAGFAASGDGLNLGGNRQGDFLGTVASNVQANGGMNAVVIARKAGGVKQSRGAATRAEDADVSARAEEQRGQSGGVAAEIVGHDDRGGFGGRLAAAEAGSLGAQIQTLARGNFSRRPASGRAPMTVTCQPSVVAMSTRAATS